MRIWTWKNLGLGLVLMALLSCQITSAFDLVPSVIGNDQYLKGRLGFGDPNGGLIGPYASWNDQDWKHVWGAGVFGQYDISPQARAVIGTVFGVPETWWESLDQVGARVYVGDEVGACNLAGPPEAQTTPFLGARLFVLTAEIGYNVFEGGKIVTDNGRIAKSGMAWFIGVGRTFRW